MASASVTRFAHLRHTFEWFKHASFDVRFPRAHHHPLLLLHRDRVRPTVRDGAIEIGSSKVVGPNFCILKFCEKSPKSIRAATTIRGAVETSGFTTRFLNAVEKSKAKPVTGFL